jgi:uncharacterized protein (TIGR01777 family)
MKIAMTGATGLVGNLTGQELVKSGNEIVALVRNPKTAKLDFPAKIFAWDAGKSEVPTEALKDVDAVLHLAGENVAHGRWTAKRKRALVDSRIKAAFLLKQALNGRRLKLFLSASAIGIYGDRGNEWLDVDSKAGGDFLARLCVAWEQAADEVPAERIVKVRFGIVLSRNGGFIEQVIPMFKRFGASRLSSGEQWFSWIHGGDTARLLATVVAEESVRGVIHAVAPAPVTNEELTAELAKRLHVRRAPPVPWLALRALYGEMANSLVASQRVKASNIKGFEFQYPQLEKALAEILPAPL